MTQSIAEDFVNRIQNGDAIIGVIGMGYVGIPLSHAFVNAGLKVIGFDVLEDRVKNMNDGKSPIKTFDSAKLKGMIKKGLFEASSDMSRLSEADALLICVPTPLNLYREPDLSYVVKSTETIAKTLRKGQLVVLESTTWPGTSDEVMRPILEATGLSSQTDFAIAYSPEREDPGNKDFDTGKIPKVVGADSEAGAKMALALYETAVSEVVHVSDTRTAEAVKLTENIFRSVNIALVNEMKGIFNDMKIDVWEVIDAAKTKPFGYMPFYPGPGLGGHCIPIDPFYLTWKARAFGRPTRFIELAGEINDRQPTEVVNATSAALNKTLRKALSDSTVMIVGVSYKEDIDDMRESPSFHIWELLEEHGANVVYHDPYIPEIPHTHEHEEFTGRKSMELTVDTLKGVNAIIIATHHGNVDYEFLMEHVDVIVDTRNAIHKSGLVVPEKLVKA